MSNTLNQAFWALKKCKSPAATTFFRIQKCQFIQCNSSIFSLTVQKTFINEEIFLKEVVGLQKGKAEWPKQFGS